MSRPPKPLTIFEKPKHPRYNWDAFTKRRHEESVARAIQHDIEVRERRKLKGWPSLKASKPSKRRFGRLPKQQRPLAEAELARRVNLFIAEHGHHPSHPKYASLIANVTYIFSYVRSGKHNASRSRHVQARRLLDKIGKEAARAGTPAAPLDPKRRSGWNLPGI